jgi:Chaperone of endosialidase
LNGIRNIQVSTYRYKSNPSHSKSFGLIAQNMAEYFPEVVAASTNAEGKKILGVAYNKIGVLALKAIQEQQEIIDRQQKQITALEEKLTRIEKLIKL